MGKVGGTANEYGRRLYWVRPPCVSFSTFDPLQKHMANPGRCPWRVLCMQLCIREGWVGWSSSSMLLMISRRQSSHQLLGADPTRIFFCCIDRDHDSGPSPFGHHKAFIFRLWKLQRTIGTFFLNLKCPPVTPVTFCSVPTACVIPTDPHPPQPQNLSLPLGWSALKSAVASAFSVPQRDGHGLSHLTGLRLPL